VLLGKGSIRSGRNFLVGRRVFLGKGFPMERKELLGREKRYSPGRGFV
jgi:hypothetical protein